jgi:hypothetical protein
MVCHWSRRTLTIHRGVFCLHPSTLSVRMMPVTGSTVLSIVSMLTTCVHFEFGYLRHMPITTWDQGWLENDLARQRPRTESGKNALIIEWLRKEMHFIVANEKTEGSTFSQSSPSSKLVDET